MESKIAEIRGSQGELLIYYPEGFSRFSYFQPCCDCVRGLYCHDIEKSNNRLFNFLLCCLGHFLKFLKNKTQHSRNWIECTFNWPFFFKDLYIRKSTNKLNESRCAGSPSIRHSRVPFLHPFLFLKIGKKSEHQR